MVKKLLKHELYALFRVLIFIAAAVVLFAVFSGLLLRYDLNRPEGAFEGQELFTILIVSFYVFAICALIIAAWALGITRFYKTLFTGEGYMTLSLPATPSQLLWAKLLSSVIAMFFASVVSLLSLILLFVSFDAEILSGAGLLGTLHDLWTAITEDPLYAILLLVQAVLSIPESLLLIYAAVSLGQLFSSHRVGMILLVVAAGYVAFMLVNVFLYTPMEAYFENYVKGGVYLVEAVDIAISALADVGCFFLIRYILRNKVNLIA